MLLGDVVDQLHDEHGLADARAAEQADLAALDVGGDQVDDLDAGLEHLGGAGLLVIGRRVAVDAPFFAGDGLRLVIDRAAEQVEHAAERLRTDGNLDARAGVERLDAAHHAVGRAHGDAAHRVVAELLRDLADELLAAFALDLYGVEQVGQVAVRKPDVQNRADDLHNDAVMLLLHRETPFLRSIRALPRRKRSR